MYEVQVNTVLVMQGNTNNDYDGMAHITCIYSSCSNEIVGYSNQMAFPDGTEDNLSQRAASTIHDDDFQQAINMISDEVDQDMEKKKLAEMEGMVNTSN